MSRPPSDSADRILAAAQAQLRRGHQNGLTLELVAAEAGCAKGLVNYHFRTKSELLNAAADRLLQEREARWRAAMVASDPETVISQTWNLITTEVSDGFWTAWTALTNSTDKLTGQTVNKHLQAFGSVLSSSIAQFLRGMGLRPTVSPDEIGQLVSAAVHGFALQLANRVPENQVAGAHDALWVGILTLTDRVSP